MHLMANVHVMENNQQCTPAMSPRLPLIIHSLNTLIYVGLIHIVGGQRLLTMTSMASWKDYSGIWIVVSHHFSDYQIANALKSAHTDSESSITVQSWGIRYPCRHKKSNPKLKPKRKRRHLSLMIWTACGRLAGRNTLRSKHWCTLTVCIS